MTALVFAGLSLVIWLYLVFLHGGFWRGREAELLPIAPPNESESWPPVVAVVPARNEAETLPRCLASLLAQNYPGDFSIILVDDQSDDGTGDIARRLSENAARRLTVVTAPERPAGWTGKVWAQNCGAGAADKDGTREGYFLFTDADITYEPNSLTGLVRTALRNRTVLTSYMAKLNCTSFAEHALVPAFVYYFQMLYPFAYANRPSHPIAAAAGGCMLAERKALERTGGLASIRSALIDDCALARMLKQQGPIWIGLAHSVKSIREYPALDDIRRMVARSAYAQLGYSPLLLAGTTLGLILVFVAAPLLALLASGTTRLLAIFAWISMAWSFQPTLRYYARSWTWGVALPLLTVLYAEFTLNSAYQHFRGRGGMWKGRPQAAQNRG